jgi:hypothetical protein
MRFLRTLRTFSILYLICLASTYGQVPELQKDGAQVVVPAPGSLSDIPGEAPIRQAAAFFPPRINAESILLQIRSDPHPYSRSLANSNVNLGAKPRSQAGSRGKVRKAPLILGIAGAAVAVAGIAVATDNCGIGPCFRTAGIVTAGVGGAVAVAGFYFAFRR